MKANETIDVDMRGLSIDPEATRVCNLCQRVVRVSDCITNEANVCQLKEPCVIPPSGSAWPMLAEKAAS